MSGSQKFISRNRAPRVQIEYDVEVYGAQKKVQLPFVMGVMSDLSGKSEVPTGSVAERKFLEIDIDNFDSRMKAMKPRAAFSVPNTLTGEGNLSIDLVFEKMSDFTPAEIARKVEPLRKLLEARTQLSNLMTYMDGKAGAEELIERLVGNPEQLRALALGTGAADEQEAAFEAMKAAAPKPAPAPEDKSSDILASMAKSAPEDQAPDTSVEDALEGLAMAAIADAPEADTGDDVLAGLAADAPEDTAEEDTHGDVLAGLASEPPEAPEADTTVEDALAGMAMATPDEAPEDTSTADALADLAETAVTEDGGEDGFDDVLADIAANAPEDKAEPDISGDILAGLAEEAPEEAARDEGVDDLLADLAEAAPEGETEADESTDILATVAEAAPDGPPGDDGLEDLLADVADEAPDEAKDENGLEDLLAEMAETAVDEETLEETSGDILAEMADFSDDDDAGDDGIEGLLADMADDLPEEEAIDSGLEDLLGDMAEGAEEDEGDADTDLDDLLADVADMDADDTEEDDGLDDLLADMAADDVEDDAAEDDLDALLAGVADDGTDDMDAEESDLDALLAGVEDDDQDDNLDSLLASEDAGSGDDDLDALLAGADDAAEEDDDDLDSLLAGISDEDDEDDLEALLGGDDDVDLDALLADDGDDDLAGLSGGDLDLDDVEDTPAKAAKPKKPAFQPDFGSMSAAKLQFEAGLRRKFRIAVLGDFSGRGNKGDLEIGAALGKRKAFKLDFDTMEDVIARFATTLTLPLGNDGSAVEVELNELDDLHPDELFENVELFNELNMLRRDLKSGRNFEQNAARMQAWGGEFGDFKALSKKRSKGAEAPADLRLTDFQNLIGDEVPKPEASAVSDLISRIIGPHIVAATDNGAEAMIAAVDAALSTAMSSVLHHPDFQTIEAAWRSLELLGRRVEASAELEVVVYDVSVEEFTADLAAEEDVSQIGLYDMLVEKPMTEESGGPISAVIGLYTWEETPTHAELLARMARISAQMDAPFISAISTGFMGVKPEDRHPLVAKTWDALGEMPEAKYLGLASPRFMLRMPYGKKTEPLDRFDYEEFNVKEGMRSMLMANPALLVAVLLAETKARQGGDMSLGSIMSLNDMPFHYMTDQYGDQVALPCTERLLSVSGAAEVVARGFMPVLSVQGQNIVKLGSFQAVGGGELLGIWAGEAAKDMKSGKARMETGVGISSSAKQVGAPAKAAPAEAVDDGGDDLAFGLDDDDDDLDMDLGGDDDFDLDLGDDDDGMDDLLAGFGDDDDDDDDDDGDMDADLAALLGDL